MKRENLVKGNMYFDKRSEEQSLEGADTLVYVGKSDIGFKFRVDYKHALSRFVEYTAADLPYIKERI